MTRNNPFNIQEEASRWVARMDADCWDEAAEEALSQWLAADPRHDGALLRAQAAWASLGLSAAPAELGPRKAAGLNRRNFLVGGAAVAAGLAGGVAFLLSGTTYRTGIGEIRRVPLADGSTVTVNTASSVSVDFDDSLRRVRVDKGEAWFQVAKDTARPFLVEAGRVRVKAVGTAFSVRRRDGRADILVTEGVVEVWTDGASQLPVRVSAGARAFIWDDSTVERTVNATASIDRALAWRSGKIDLDGETLEEAVAEFNRYNQRKLRIVDPKLAREAFDGVFRVDDPEGFARVVEVSLQVPVDSAPSEIRIGRPGS
jgi:transmembrane sensor